MFPLLRILTSKWYSRYVRYMDLVKTYYCTTCHVVLYYFTKWVCLFVSFFILLSHQNKATYPRDYLHRFGIFWFSFYCIQKRDCKIDIVNLFVIFRFSVICWIGYFLSQKSFAINYYFHASINIRIVSSINEHK